MIEKVGNYLGNSPVLDYRIRKILNENITFPICVNLHGTSAQTAGNYDTFFIADSSYEIIQVIESHVISGTDGGAVNTNIEKLESGVALDSGYEILSSPFNLKLTANTPQYGVLTTTKVNLILNKGDRLALKDSGTLSTLSGITVIVYIRKI